MKNRDPDPLQIRPKDLASISMPIYPLRNERSSSSVYQSFSVPVIPSDSLAAAVGAMTAARTPGVLTHKIVGLAAS